jgi:lipopolysaccharide/colanic/teichoic acid biosynthesis glycosyltransferase
VAADRTANALGLTVGKRLFDVLASALGLVLLAPLFLIVALVIKLDTPGPVFYRQQRVGRHGLPFRIFKFRTMAHRPVGSGTELTVAGDDRITRCGAWLRRYKLDELPQLIDVLRGTMSLVGPRPEVPRYVAHYPEAWRERVLSVRPGITDFASLHFRAEGELLARAADPEREYLDVILPSKLRYALQYVENVGMADDLRVLGLTLRTVFVPSISPASKVSRMVHRNVWEWLQRNMSAPHPHRRWWAVGMDAALVLLCWHFTYLFRLGFERYQPGRPWYDDYVSFGAVAMYLLCLWALGVGRGIWRYFAFDDLKRIAWGCLLAGALSAAVVLMAQLTAVARAVLLLHPLFCLLSLSLPRMAFRMVWERAQAETQGHSFEPRRAIILGAGDVARRLVAGIHLREGWTVVGLLDDDPRRRGLRVGGVTVLGAVADLMLPHIHAQATHVILAMPSASAAQRESAMALARQLGLPVLTVPGESELHAEVRSGPPPEAP